MTVISAAGVTGIDGGTPIVDKGLWKEWALSEIYTGQQGANRYVPKLRDFVRDTDNDIGYIVDDLDLTTLIPTLTKRKATTEIGLTDEDVILGVGPGTQNDTMRIFIDRSTLPYTLAVDQRYTVKGANNMSAKIYRGTVTANDQKVISAFFDPSGTLLGEDVPLELVQQDGNVSVKQVSVCYTTEDIPDNEPLTVVVFNAAGTPVSMRWFLAQNSAFIRKPGSAKKYITSIYMESPFLSKNDPNKLNYPINVPTEGLVIMGVVKYSDGSKLTMPVDGTKFALHGLENYAATVPAQQTELTLIYTLSSDEVAYEAQIGEVPFMKQTYIAETIPADGAYSVKLFGYPVWIDATHGYRMEWFLYNLDRQVVYKATPYVSFNTNTPAFDPKNYGVRQALSVSVNIKDVNPAYNAYVHTQSIDISLMAAGTARETNWTIAFNANQDPQYGKNNSAVTQFVSSNQTKVKIDQGEATLDTWLARLFGLTKPLYDSARELQAPTPTHFALVSGEQSVEFPVSSWADQMTVGFAIADSSTLFVKFFKRTVDNDIQLAIAGLTVYQSN